METLEERLKAYENFQLEETEVVELFREIIKSGKIYSLERHYRISAAFMMQKGTLF